MPEDVPAEAEDAPEAAVIPEALDAVVTEEAELALDEALDFDISNILLPDLLWLDIVADQHLASIKIGNQTKLEGINLHGYGKMDGPIMYPEIWISPDAPVCVMLIWDISIV